jgi:protein-L-isoaspartate(D-aspartate) O-methyltransferase
VQVREGDGYRGWKEEAPFDAILVTAAPKQVPPPLLEQLKPAVRLVIPVGSVHAVQQLMVITRTRMEQPAKNPSFRSGCPADREAESKADR